MKISSTRRMSGICQIRTEETINVNCLISAMPKREKIHRTNGELHLYRLFTNRAQKTIGKIIEG